MGQYSIAPNSNIALSYPGVFAGPVSITADIPVYSTLKSRTNGKDVYKRQISLLQDSSS